MNEKAVSREGRTEGGSVQKEGLETDSVKLCQMLGTQRVKSQRRFESNDWLNYCMFHIIR